MVWMASWYFNSNCWKLAFLKGREWAEWHGRRKKKGEHPAKGWEIMVESAAVSQHVSAIGSHFVIAEVTPTVGICSPQQPSPS